MAGTTRLDGRLISSCMARPATPGELVAESVGASLWRRRPALGDGGPQRRQLAEVRDLIGAPQDTPLIVADRADCRRSRGDGGADPRCGDDRGATSRALWRGGAAPACVTAGTELLPTFAGGSRSGCARWSTRCMSRKPRRLAARVAFSSGFEFDPLRSRRVFVLQQEAAARFGARRRRALSAAFVDAGGTLRRHGGRPWRDAEGAGANPSLIPIIDEPVRPHARLRRRRRPAGDEPFLDKGNKHRQLGRALHHGGESTPRTSTAPICCAGRPYGTDLPVYRRRWC